MVQTERDAAFSILRQKLNNPQRDPDDDTWPVILRECHFFPSKGSPVETFNLQGAVWRKVKINETWWLCMPLPSNSWACKNMKDEIIRVVANLGELYALAYAAPLINQSPSNTPENPGPRNNPLNKSFRGASAQQEVLF